MENQSTQDNTAQEPVIDRATLRQQMLAKRMSLSTEQWQTDSAHLVRHLVSALSARGEPLRGQVMAFCWPIQNEPDVRGLVTEWAERFGIVPALPVVIAPGQALRFRAWHPGDILQADRYGIPTPMAGPWVCPEILLLPGNAFDDRGYRLGYGGGYFDRTLAELHPRPYVLGLCFESARVRSVQPEAHDQPVDVVVTELGVQKTPILSPRHG